MIDAFGEFGISDAFDVAIVAALLYAGISWLRRSQAALVALGMGLLGVVYLTARLFELHLTTWVFHGFFARQLVLVVIFQEELRQGFEGLAAFAMGQRASTAAHGRADVSLALAGSRAKTGAGRAGRHAEARAPPARRRAARRQSRPRCSRACSIRTARSRRRGRDRTARSRASARTCARAAPACPTASARDTARRRSVRTHGRALPGGLEERGTISTRATACCGQSAAPGSSRA
jgi:hypothetical protein